MPRIEKAKLRIQKSSIQNDKINEKPKRKGKEKFEKLEKIEKIEKSQRKERKEKSKLRVISLGGLGEIGKNITVIEYENDIIIVDCGLGFPDEDMLGIDLVIPDVTYLEENADKIRGLFLTHGHEDHIGAIPYILRQINPPIYGTRLTLGILQNKLSEHSLPYKPTLNCVDAGDTIRVGAFSVEFIHVNHSIADACALAIGTPVGMLIHSGDLKIDVTPIDGDMIDLTRFGELGKKGVLMFMCESTNAERAGHSPSERAVGRSLEYIFTLNKDKRIVIATFSSNVHRVQQIIDASVRHSRKVAITGRSMQNIVGAAVELGYMNLPEGALIDINEIKRFKPEEITVITTGSQGEPMSALFRMAAGEHSQVTLGANDLVVLSSSPIPGNEKLISRIVNELVNHGVSVLRDSAFEVHVSGHAYRDELKLLTSLIKPKFFMPIHGEYRHLAANKELAEEVGIPSSRVIISDVGKIVELDRKSAKLNGTVASGKVLVDGYGVGDVGNIVLNDRRHLSQDGIIVVVASIDRMSGMLMAGPEIVSRGFVYVREAEELMDGVREVAAESICRYLDRARRLDRMELKNTLKDDLTKYLYSKTKRRPMIMPIIMDV
jgi:ribonuclease J